MCVNVLCRICKSRQTFTGFSYVSACSGLYQQLSWSQAADPICHLLEPTKRHMFSKKRYKYSRYIYYVQLCTDYCSRKWFAHILRFCCLNATGSQPEVTTHCAQCLPLANSPLATWDTQDTQPPNLNIFKTRQILRNDQPHNSRNDHLFSFTDTNPNDLTMQ